VGLLVLALLLGACGAASADTGSDPVRPCSYLGTALAKVARAPSGPATDTSGALAGVPAAGTKLTSVDLAPADAAVQAPASGTVPTMKVATRSAPGTSRVAGGVSAVPAEACT
jgi:hypothetical protein